MGTGIGLRSFSRTIRDRGLSAFSFNQGFTFLDLRVGHTLYQDGQEGSVWTPHGIP